MFRPVEISLAIAHLFLANLRFSDTTLYCSCDNRSATVPSDLLSRGLYGTRPRLLPISLSLPGRLSSWEFLGTQCVWAISPSNIPNSGFTSYLHNSLSSILCGEHYLLLRPPLIIIYIYSYSKYTVQWIVWLLSEPQLLCSPWHFLRLSHRPGPTGSSTKSWRIVRNRKTFPTERTSTLWLLIDTCFSDEWSLVPFQVLYRVTMVILHVSFPCTPWYCLGYHSLAYNQSHQWTI